LRAIAGGLLDPFADPTRVETRHDDDRRTTDGGGGVGSEVAAAPLRAVAARR
jgi:hypothetical protein